MDPTWLERQLFRLYRLALRGDPHALGILFRYGVHCLETGQEMPRGVARLMVRDLKDPARYAARMTRTKRVTRRGRASIDDLRRSKFLDDLPALTGKQFFGRLPSEKNALMIQYLRSCGLTLNEAPGPGRDSAVTVLAGLVNRSGRQLQRDEERHRSKLTGSPSQLEVGKTLFDTRRRLRDIKERGR